MQKIHLASAILFDSGGRLGLLRRKVVTPPTWELVGGKVKHEERVEDASMREAFEELGVTTSVVRHIGQTSFDGSWAHFTQDHFELKVIWDGHPTPREEHMFDRFEYFSREELDSVPASLGVTALLEAVDSNSIQLPSLSLRPQV